MDGGGPGVLSPRERDIAVLIGEGLTDDAIGRRLGLARAEVAHHVGGIQARLGVGSRLGIAWWAGARW